MHKKDTGIRLLDYCKVWLQYILPQHTLTAIIYKLTRLECKIWKNTLIRIFIQLFKVEMQSAVKQKPEEFKHFNEFFTRELTKAARPIAENLIVSPVDGFISQMTSLDNDRLVQAKGHRFTLNNLLANDDIAIKDYIDGLYTTIYLSPKNYHRIHMPIDAQLTKMTYVPGKLFAVNKHTTHLVNNLFARNERVILHFQTLLGPMIMILVGALFVGSIETVWQGEITPSKKKAIENWDYQDETLYFKKGEGIARFNMGSTVILLFPKHSLIWQAGLEIDQAIIMGQALANAKE